MLFLRNLLICFINGSFVIKSVRIVTNLKAIFINININNNVAVSINLIENAFATPSIVLLTSPTILLVKLSSICTSWFPSEF